MPPWGSRSNWCADVMAGAAALGAIAIGLNERQRAYLLAAYAEDQAREERYRGPGGPPVRIWRWVEYGPSAGLSQRFLIEKILLSARV
jgi:hypothetical protein